jgi:hypothetical protein
MKLRVRTRKFTPQYIGDELALIVVAVWPARWRSRMEVRQS